jgi:hypothetical protein
MRALVGSRRGDFGAANLLETATTTTGILAHRVRDEVHVVVTRYYWLPGPLLLGECFYAAG